MYKIMNLLKPVRIFTFFVVLSISACSTTPPTQLQSTVITKPTGPIDTIHVAYIKDSLSATQYTDSTSCVTSKGANYPPEIQFGKKCSGNTEYILKIVEYSKFEEYIKNTAPNVFSDRGIHSDISLVTTSEYKSNPLYGMKLPNTEGNPNKLLTLYFSNVKFQNYGTRWSAELVFDVNLSDPQQSLALWKGQYNVNLFYMGSDITDLFRNTYFSEKYVKQLINTVLNDLENSGYIQLKKL